VFGYILFPAETVRSSETPDHSSATVRINLKYQQLMKEVQKDLVLKNQEGGKTCWGAKGMNLRLS